MCVGLEDQTEVREDAGMTDAYNSTGSEQSRRHREGDNAFDQHDAFNRSEAELIFTNLQALRNRIIIAWQERGVILSSEEQRDLRNEDTPNLRASPKPRWRACVRLAEVWS